MKRLLWVGDAVAATGFARITHKVLDVVANEWQVSVLGLNYHGDPHKYPYPIFPCWPGGDAFGVHRIAKIVKAVKPDVILIQNDPWNIPAYVQALKDDKTPIVVALAVDGKNCQGGRYLQGVSHAIFWTKFGAQEAQRGGWTGPTSVIPLGVDLGLYQPIPREKAREFLGLPPQYNTAFIVGNVNRNQPRKRLDLCVMYFHEWMKRDKIEDAYLHLQIAPTGDLGYDVRQLKSYLDPGGRPWLIMVEPEIGHGIPEEMLPMVYNAFDVQMTTTQGEGWGLTTLEGMACGIPQLVPVWSAYEEWASAALGAKCTSVACTPNKTGVIGGIPDREQMINGLRQLYRNQKLREQMARDGMLLAARPEYRWENIGQRYVEVLETIKIGEEVNAEAQVQPQGDPSVQGEGVRADQGDAQGSGQRLVYRAGVRDDRREDELRPGA